ncbi:hypothetical protein KDD17_02890 [Sulfitobacter albidus]|uniref:Uncharacterized protein n=1 Tax=Sulfitobacter albidus TaxID=2829501 RepID=A0A975JEK0_9RHOB|nr:hypothetical protein [Sulfitobacter albidus]QUJ77008.1 hypothetical protein KDD17_02890 [Sulfitobacter albidus]
MKKILLSAALCLAATTAAATDWDVLQAKSQLINREANFLKSKNASSVYASTKAYCPSTFWWSGRPSAKDNAKRGFRRQISREMENVGFSQAVIDHCVDNSGFLLENSTLRQHPKNDRYTDYVKPGIMIVRDKSTGTKTIAPVLFETNSFTDRVWQVFGANFAKICTLRGPADALKLNCNGYGELRGTFSNTANGRSTTVMRNTRYDLAIFVRRSRSYATRNFDALF